MDRITQRHIDGCCETLNIALGLPVAPYVDGKPQAGNIHADLGYGGVSIVQMSDSGSGTSTLSDRGTKREAWQWLCAAIRGAQLQSHSIKASPTRFKFESDKECMIFINALNHYSKTEDVQNLLGLDQNQFHGLVDDFKSFAINYPGGLDPTPLLPDAGL